MFLLFFCLFETCLLGFAQQQAASLTGVVSDTSGATVSDATVTVSDPLRAIKQSTNSNDRGEYIFPQLPPSDNYILSVSKAGFKETIQRGVVLQVAQSAKIDLTLQCRQPSRNRHRER